MLTETSNKKTASATEVDYRYDRALVNIKRIGPFSSILAAYVFWLGMISLHYLINGMPLSIFLPFIMPYFVFFVFNIACIFISKKVTFNYAKNYSVPIINKKLILVETFIVFYIFVVVLFGTYMSLLDQELYGHIIVYIICLISTICCFYLSSKQAISIILISVVLLVAFLPTYQSDSTSVTLHYLNLGLFVPLCFLVSRIIYRDYKSKFKYIQLLARETKTNKNLNKELEQANHLLSKLASIDELTNISNRRGLQHYLDISLENCGEQEITMTAFMADVDYFKAYNDTYGHLEGDNILKAVSSQLNIVANDRYGFAARWGGEEFILVMFGMESSEAIKLNKTILDLVRDLKLPHESSPIAPYVTISIGSCTMNVKSMKDINSAIEGADKALYYAKEQGKNSFKSFNFIKDE